MRNPRNEPLSAARSKRAPAELARSGPGKPVPERKGNSEDKADPERKCVLTGRHDARGELLRLALAPDGSVHPDALARAPGRGAWVGVPRGELDRAVASGKLRGALARAFKGASLSIPENLGALAEAALTRALTDRLGIELRSGMMVLGTEKIAAAARSGVVTFLAHATDAGSDGAGKLAQAWRVGEMAEGSGRKGIILPLDRAALSVALGRDNVVHLALTDAAATQRVEVPLRRLLHFLGREGADVAGQAPAANDIDTKDE